LKEDGGREEKKRNKKRKGGEEECWRNKKRRNRNVEDLICAQKSPAFCWVSEMGRNVGI